MYSLNFSALISPLHFVIFTQTHDELAENNKDSYESYNNYVSSEACKMQWTPLFLLPFYYIRESWSTFVSPLKVLEVCKKDRKNLEFNLDVSPCLLCFFLCNVSSNFFRQKTDLCFVLQLGWALKTPPLFMS